MTTYRGQSPPTQFSSWYGPSVSSRHLVHLARLYGIRPTWADAWGKAKRVSPETLRSLLGALGVAAHNDAEVRHSIGEAAFARWRSALPPTVVVEQGQPVRLDVSLPAGAVDRIAYCIELESSGRLAGTVGAESCAVLRAERSLGLVLRRVPLASDLPLGVHRAEVTCGSTTGHTNLIVAPRRSYIPPALERGERLWGLALQLYGVRSHRNLGMGDLRDLAEICEQAAGHGAGCVGINPVHALFLGDPNTYSPYTPSSRAFLNALYIAIDDVPEFATCEHARHLWNAAAFHTRMLASRAGEFVDYPAVAALKMPVLAALQHCCREVGPASERGKAFHAFVAAGGEALRRQAAFDTLHEHFYRGGAGEWDWRRWPDPYRRHDSAEVGTFVRQHHERVAFFAWLQFEADRQLGEAQRRGRAAGMALGLYQDIAVASHPGGSMAWSFPNAMLNGISVGAPPDAFNALGQSWGAAAFSPTGLRATGYAPLRASLAASMRHAGAVRIDHAMGLQRLFLVPDGAKPTEGAYLHYPCRDQQLVVALESQRAQCMVVGEDLGTVAPGFREAMADAGALSYRVLYFERGWSDEVLRPQHFPRQALVTATTHDLPTLVGWWRGRDLEWRERLKLFADESDKHSAWAIRQADKRLLVDALVEQGLLPSHSPREGSVPPEGFVGAVYAYLARTPSMLVMATAEDVLGDSEQPNLPGTVDEHPNWRRKLPGPIEVLVRELGPLARLLAR